MKKRYLLPIFILFGYSISAQVGINTEDPKATLDVRAVASTTVPDGIIPPRLTGNQLEAKQAMYGNDQDGAIVYVTAGATTTGPKTVGVITTGLYVYDAYANNFSGAGLWKALPTSGTNTSGTGDGAYSSRVSGTLSLLNLGINLLGSSIQTVPLPMVQSLPDANVDIASAQVTTTGSDSYYTIPSTGIYQINYSYRTGQGLRLELLGSSRPGLIVTKTALGAAATTATPVDFRYFGGISLGAITIPLFPVLPNINISLANLALTSGQISHIYQFTAGDRVRFGVVTGGLAAGVLTDSSAEVSIYKVK